MAFAATADVDRFEEAIAWFSARFPLTAELLETLGVYAGERAWTIAAVANLDAILTAHSIISNAIERGTVLREVVEQLGDALSEYHFGRARLETIVLTNTQSAYNAGRYRQLSDPDLIALRPYRQVDGIGDERQTEYCRAIDGLTLPATDPWWESHWFPAHFRCRTTVRSIRQREYDRVPDERRQIPIGVAPADGFGMAPDVGEPWQPDLSGCPPELRRSLEDLRADHVREEAARPPTHYTDVSEAIAHRTLTREQREAVSDFTGGSYGAIRAVQGPGPARTRSYNRRYVAQAEALEAAIAANTPYRGALWRGITVEPEVAERLLHSESLDWLSQTTSTSTDPSAADRFAHADLPGYVGIVFHTANGRGMPVGGLDVAEAESEVIQSGSSRFRVTGRHQRDDGVWQIDLEQLA